MVARRTLYIVDYRVGGAIVVNETRRSSNGMRLDLVSILVVEDAVFIRSLLVGMLRALGVGSVHVARDGADAAAFLEERAANLPPGASPVDITLTDLMMPNIDGMTLLRWIRRSPRSSDRFLPVVMLSGAADRRFVEEARDLGVTEFMAKPFTAAGVGDRLMRVLARPRRFVLCNGYFGPDRRRSAKPVQVDCRMTRDDEILVVHTGLRTVDLDRRPVVHFELPNRLGAKVGLKPGASVPVFARDVLAAAEAEISNRAGDYARWIAGMVEETTRDVERLATNPDQTAEILARVNRAAHEMRGQGGIFGYPLVTMFAKSLFEATSRGAEPVDDRGCRLLRAHVDAIRAVTAGKIGGDGGAVGRRLLETLDEAKRRYGGDD